MANDAATRRMVSTTSAARSCEDFDDADGVLVVDDHDFAPAEQDAVDSDVDGSSGCPIEFND